MDWIGKNPVPSLMAMQAGLSFFGGAFGGAAGPSEAQQAMWAAQAENNLAAARYQDQITANLQSGIPRSNKPPPYLMQQKTAGNTVTGVPA